METKLNGKNVVIRELTEYPYGNSITFEIESESDFELKIRKPGWAENVKTNAPYKEIDGFCSIGIKKGKSKIEVEFSPEVVTKQDANGEYFFQYGSLVLAHPIAALEEQTKMYDLPKFRDLEYKPENLVIYQYKIPEKIRALGKLGFETTLFNPKTQKEEKITLIPMGKTILRQTTFKKN
ncbi:hypothetical protein [Flavobacterium sp. 3HN19-14]|uniref:hypothetical protein n=1 Tax=Flavobacterium sp. 3HN19-14 TaxID=3448133 RepID=UPI003EDF1252